MQSRGSSMAHASYLAVVLALAAAACSSPGAGTTTAATTPKSPEPTSVTISNQGGALEGHTPIGFAGTGSGLFVGDNLNPSFPEGDGVQTYMTFALPDTLTVGNAILASDALSTNGMPFEDLGPLLVEPVVYEEFGPHLFDLPATGPATACRVTGETSVACDVTEIVNDAVDQGRPAVQFRLRFERIADNDGQPDLAQFFRSDVNTNEPGLFGLTITNNS